MPPVKKPRAATITLRELTPAEIPAMFPLIKLHNPAITKALFTKRLKDMLPFGYRVIAAFDGPKMAAISGYWLHSRFWCGRQLDIDNFIVDNAYRSQGIGSRLVAWFEQKALAEHVDLIVLDAYADNFDSHRFYVGKGFIATGYHFTKVPGTMTPWKKKS